ncbi:MAG: transcriptional regulator [Gemmatimonas sp.]|nr:transcriptional regulator [Gemmatimonas sp.]
MKVSRQEKLLDLVRKAGILRPRDLDDHGIPRQYLRILCDSGVVERVGRGLYVASDAEPSEYQTLAAASKRVPQGVICLLSALQFHGLTTQSPFEVWMAIERTSRKPRANDLPLCIVRFSGEAFSSFIENQDFAGVELRVYSPAKTVADCFKYRNKIGLDVAIEALRETWRRRRATMDELWRAAAVCRVQNVMRPTSSRSPEAPATSATQSHLIVL